MAALAARFTPAGALSVNPAHDLIVADAAGLVDRKGVKKIIEIPSTAGCLAGL